MYGKTFASMYSGSMVGAGSVVFAVWGYVIANAVPDREVGSQVELNPKLLAAIIGDPEEKILEAIEFLCAPDVNSRSKEKEGRRLVRLAQFDYQVVNGVTYRRIRDEEQRREQNRLNKRKQRLRMGRGLPGEGAYLAAENGGASADQLDRQVTEALPEK